ncbi:MAG: hypothetical protein QM673_16180 [Gordonia sp. (in: high G+C Gram-positive bacteria)]
MDIVAKPNDKWPGYLDVVVIPDDSEVDIEMWVFLVADDGIDIDEAILDVAKRLERMSDEYESCRYEPDPNTGQAGPIDRMAVVRRTELLVDRILPPGVFVDEVS